jgi:hypothetical protein
MRVEVETCLHQVELCGHLHAPPRHFTAVRDSALGTDSIGRSVDPRAGLDAAEGNVGDRPPLLRILIFLMAS